MARNGRMKFWPRAASCRFVPQGVAFFSLCCLRSLHVRLPGMCTCRLEESLGQVPRAKKTQDSRLLTQYEKRNFGETQKLKINIGVRGKSLVISCFLRREWGFPPLCAAAMTSSHCSEDRVRPENIGISTEI